MPPPARLAGIVEAMLAAVVGAVDGQRGCGTHDGDSREPILITNPRSSKALPTSSIGTQPRGFRKSASAASSRCNRGPLSDSTARA
jgi:hypothetical protein